MLEKVACSTISLPAFTTLYRIAIEKYSLENWPLVQLKRPLLSSSLFFYIELFNCTLHRKLRSRASISKKVQKNMLKR